jgi:hypothetical protein
MCDSPLYQKYYEECNSDGWHDGYQDAIADYDNTSEFLGFMGRSPEEGINGECEVSRKAEMDRYTSDWEEGYEDAKNDYLSLGYFNRELE